MIAQRNHDGWQLAFSQEFIHYLRSKLLYLLHIARLAHLNRAISTPLLEIDKTRNAMISDEHLAPELGREISQFYENTGISIPIPLYSVLELICLVQIELEEHIRLPARSTCTASISSRTPACARLIPKKHRHIDNSSQNKTACVTVPVYNFTERDTRSFESQGLFSIRKAREQRANIYGGHT